MLGGPQVSRPPTTQGGVPIRVHLPSLGPKKKGACRRSFILKTKTEGLREDVGEVVRLPTSGRTPTLPSLAASASPRYTVRLVPNAVTRECERPEL